MSSRVLNFADGFSSASAPTAGGGNAQEPYTIANNVVFDLFATDSSIIRSVFANFRMQRKTDSAGTFSQTGSLEMHFDGTNWALTFGNYTGTVGMITPDFITSTEQVKLALDPVTGMLSYQSGNMLGANYKGYLILEITRIVEV